MGPKESVSFARARTSSETPSDPPMVGNRREDLGTLATPGRVHPAGAGGIDIGDLTDLDLRIGAQALDVLLAGIGPEALLELAHGDHGVFHARSSFKNLGTDTNLI